jgi:hypothetical protein
MKKFPLYNVDAAKTSYNGYGVPDSLFRAVTQISQNIFTGAMLTDGPTINTDASLGCDFYVTLDGNRTMAAPENPGDWKIIRYWISQDEIGSRTLTWNAVFKFSTGLPSPTLTTTLLYTDMIEFIYNPNSLTWNCLRIVKGFS